MQVYDDLELLKQLMAYGSVSSRSNRPIAEFAAAQLERTGAAIELIASEDEQYINVVASIGPESSDRAGLVLSGHLDVVPADEPQWTSDPFTAREEHGKLFGRGSCDMLGAVAMFVNLFRAVDNERLTAPLAVVLSYGEELGSIGGKRLVQVWPGARKLPRACVIGEPTSLRVVRLHKGHLKMRISIAGKAAHSGSPHLGCNAIEAATPVLAALSSLRAELEQERPANGEYFDAVPFVALNIARVRAGDALNVIPETCVIELGLRPLPGMDSSALVERVEQCVYSVGDSAKVDVAVLDNNPPMLTSDEAEVYRVLTDIVDQRETIGVSYSSDGGVFGSHLGMECVLFGPGSIEYAHRPNEFVPIAELTRAREVMTRLVESLCMQQAGGS